MASTFHQNPDAHSRALSVFVLPGPSGEAWALCVPQALACCVGTYARIPEFAVTGSLLSVAHIGGPRG